MTVSLVKDKITTRDGDELERVSAMVARTFNLKARRYAFTGTTQERTDDGYWAWVDAETPGAGDRLAVSDLDWQQRPWNTDRPTFVLLEFASWGDYAGSSYTRSNYRSLLRDFPDTFVDVYGDHGYSALALNLATYVPEHLADCLNNLADQYPVYDEGDWSELEMELQTEGWANHGREDFRREIVSQLRNLGWLGSVGVDADDLAESITDEQLDRLFWDAYSQGEHRVEMECEDAVSAYFRTDDLAAFVARSLAVRGLAGVA